MRFALFLCLLLVFPMKTLADIKSCQRLYSRGPTVLNGLKLVSTKDYETQRKGAGYGLHYGKSSKNRISLIFFDSGKGRISKDFAVEQLIVSTKVIMALKGKQAQKAGNVHFTDDNLPVPGDPSAAIMHIGTSKNSLGNEYLMMGVIDNCIYKFRYSIGGSNKRADRNFYKAVAELGAHFDKRS